MAEGGKVAERVKLFQQNHTKVSDEFRLFCHFHGVRTEFDCSGLFTHKICLQSCLTVQTCDDTIQEIHIFYKQSV